MRIPILLGAILGCAALLSSGCGNSDGPAPTGGTGTRAGTVSFTVIWPQKTRLIPMVTASIKATLSTGSTVVGQQLATPPASGNTSTVSFHNVDVGVLTLTATAYPNGDGTGTALASGSVSVTVVAEQTSSVTVTMQSTIDHIDLSPTSPSVTQGSATVVTPTAKDAAGAIVLLSSAKLQWSSDNTSVATVSSGVVSGVLQGTAHISVTDSESNKSASVLFTVNPPIVSNPFLYDGFDYTAGSPVAGQNGGTGTFGGPWNEYGQGETPSVISSGSLTFPGLKTSGNAILTTSDFPVGHARRFSTSPGKTGGVLFISCLIEPLDQLNVGYPNTYFGLGYGGVGMDKPGNSAYYCLEGAGTFVSTGVPVVPGQTVFLVERITFGPLNGNDTVDMWVNPTPGQPLPAPMATRSDINTGVPADFNFGGSIRCMYDEIRFGRTFNDVAPVQ